MFLDYVNANRYVNVFGCDRWLYSRGREFGEMSKKKKDDCNDPTAWGWIAIFYFISFCIIAGQVLMTLFIGIIATGLSIHLVQLKAAI